MRCMAGIMCHNGLEVSGKIAEVSERAQTLFHSQILTRGTKELFKAEEAALLEHGDA